MVTLVIDEGIIVAIFITIVIIAFMMLFFAYTETKSELDHERWKSSYYEREYEKYFDKYLEYRKKI
ncbi:MAG: hypothetical protein BZ138_07330 [Methanosphaera sp. rholeuAM270]|nr:MAG: hypothetical protein BZ138_07330 [Methanosphaera sp. rholeuAM270]